jgi:hypothetical protein
MDLVQTIEFLASGTTSAITPLSQSYPDLETHPVLQ